MNAIAMAFMKLPDQFSSWLTLYVHRFELWRRGNIVWSTIPQFFEENKIVVKGEKSVIRRSFFTKCSSSRL
jgi:hypothetical protein